LTITSLFGFGAHEDPIGQILKIPHDLSTGINPGINYAWKTNLKFLGYAKLSLPKYTKAS